ncbi:hypothetical protein DPMN_102929 [Dreissena polymorpha]|uniref:Uncharacterized protein n=1 Tax=Dreissena polymorpha TaxID=45954 RepID=A0A9D4JZM5_DREPO|nr:hypothetical protein DPMN_102929 [Dreissena polymorpha]
MSPPGPVPKTSTTKWKLVARLHCKHSLEMESTFGVEGQDGTLLRKIADSALTLPVLEPNFEGLCKQFGSR